jgi:hypothetical protein
MLNQAPVGSQRLQLIPGGGPALYVDGFYGPYASTCPYYGAWPMMWLPTVYVDGYNNGIQHRSGSVGQYNQVVWVTGVMTETIACPRNQLCYEPPQGMTQVTGNHLAMAEAEQDNVHVYWTCGSIDPAFGSPRPKDCSNVWGPQGVVTTVFSFADCWDGHNSYQSPNPQDNTFDASAGIDRKHFYYSDANQSCGDGILIAKVVLSASYGDPVTRRPLVNPYNFDGSQRVTFSSGPYFTVHADFVQTWAVNMGWFVAGCLNHQQYYGGFADLTQNVTGLACPVPRCDGQDAPGSWFYENGIYVDGVFRRYSSFSLQSEGNFDHDPVDNNFPGMGVCKDQD